MPTLKSLTRTAEDVDGWYRTGVWRQQTLGSLLRYHAMTRPATLALVDERRALTFHEYDAESRQIAGVLHDLGVHRDDRVAVWLEGRVEFPLVRVALAHLGAVAVLLNHGLAEADLVAALDTADCSAIVTSQTLRGQATRPALERAHDACAALDTIVLIDGEDDGLPRLLARRTHERFEPSDAHLPHEVDDILFTSGTTGKPKGVLSCQARWITACRGQRSAGGFGPGDVGLVLAPLGGAIGYLKSVVLPLVSGTTTVLTTATDSSALIELALRTSVSYVATVPAQLIRLTDALGAPGELPLRIVFYGGAALAPENGALLRELTGCFLLTSIGSSEAGTPGGTQLGDPPNVQIETVGTAYPGSRIAIRDGDGVAVGPNEVGELYSRGATLFDGYLDDREATAGRFVDGWIRHGDLASIDDGGYVRFAGRADDVINRGGTKIAPWELECILIEHPAVADVAVAGIPDRFLGQSVCAFVSIRNGAELSLEELRAFLEVRGVARYKQPERLQELSALSFTAAGKVDRASLIAAVPEVF